MSDWAIPAMLGGLMLMVVVLVGMLFLSSRDFAERCERAGGVNIEYEVCVPAGTQILMVN